MIKNILIALLLVIVLILQVQNVRLQRGSKELFDQLTLNFEENVEPKAHSNQYDLHLFEHFPFEYYHAQIIVAWIPEHGRGVILLPQVSDTSERGRNYWAWAIRGDGANWAVRAKSNHLVAERIGRLVDGRISFNLDNNPHLINRFIVTHETTDNPVFPSDKDASFSISAK